MDLLSQISKIKDVEGCIVTSVVRPGFFFLFAVDIIQSIENKELDITILYDLLNNENPTIFCLCVYCIFFIDESEGMKIIVAHLKDQRKISYRPFGCVGLLKTVSYFCAEIGRNKYILGNPLNYNRYTKDIAMMRRIISLY